MRSMTHDEFRALRRFPALDGLRAVAAVLVVAFHFGGPKWSWISGWSGVHVFFVLSGFLITTLALREEERTGRISFRNFYLRRLFRIVPVYLVVLGITMVVFAPRGEWVSDLSGAVPYYLVFLNEWAPLGAFQHTWTLGIEQKFYLVWPLIAFAAGALTMGRRLAVTFGTIAVGLVVFVVWPGLVVHYIVILLGCALAVLMHSRSGFALVRPLTHPVVGTALVVAFVAAQLALDRVQQIVGQPVALLPYAIVICLMLPGMLARSPARWLLSTRPAVFVGERSYSLYLIQLVGQMAFAWGLPHLIGAAVGVPYGTRLVIFTTAVSLLLAHMLYIVVEQPFIRIGQRLTRSHRPDGATVLVREPTAEPDGARQVPDAVATRQGLESGSRRSTAVSSHRG